MTAAINLGGYGKFNVTRVTKMLNATNKEEATKLGNFDKFAELFRWNKKYDKLCFLYDDLHAGIDSESSAPEAQQESNLNRIVIFHRMEKLAKSDYLSQECVFEVCLFDDGRKLNFKINDKIIYDGASRDVPNTKFSAGEHENFTDESVAEIKQIVDMLDNIDQSLFHKKYRFTFYEVYFAFKHCKESEFTIAHADVDNKFRNYYGQYPNHVAPEFNFLEFQAKSSDVHKQNKCSIIFYKRGNEYCALLRSKFNISAYGNAQEEDSPLSDHDPVRMGHHKVVKTSNIEIVLSHDKKLKEIKQVVTAKCITLDNNEATDDATDLNDIFNEGYRLVVYKKIVNGCSYDLPVFVQEYLGENLQELLTKNSFPLKHQRLKIIRSHWEKVRIDVLKYNDTKLDNVLYLKSNKVDSIHPIDYTKEHYIYAPNVLYYQYNSKLDERTRSEKINIFQIIYMYYKIYQNVTQDVDGICDVDKQITIYIKELNLSKGNPFAKPLQLAWRCELDWNECKNVVNKILYPDQYTQLPGGYETGVVESRRIYA